MPQPQPVGPYRRDAWLWNRARNLEESIRTLMKPTKGIEHDATGDYIRTPEDLLKAAEWAKELSWTLEEYYKVIKQG